MMRSGFTLVTTVALVTTGCGLFSQAPNQPASDVARQVVSAAATAADAKDQPFEDLMSALDLTKTYGARAGEITDQIRKTRTAVDTARKSSGATGGSRLASRAQPVSTFSIPLFALDFAQSLDDLTKKGGTRQTQPNPYTSTDSGSTFFTTTTLSVSETFSGNGSTVTATVIWKYHTISTDNKTNETAVDLSDERTMVGTIDVCPDAGGMVPASLDVNATLVGHTTAGTTKRSSTSTNMFRGTVDDQASLRGVNQQIHDQSQWESSSGNGGYDLSQSATWNTSQGGFLGGLDASSVSGTLTTSGAAAAADAAKAAGWDIALDLYAVEPAYMKAQDLWRHGRCVIVAVPEYTAETPLEVDAQEKPQHDEEVDTGSETKFAVSLKPRYGGGAVTAPTQAALTSGDKKLEPSKLEGSGGQLTYTAPDDTDKNATVQMKSVSKRGIGTLVITFRTAASNLTLSGKGSVKLTTNSFVSYSGNITIGPVALKKKDGATYAGAAPMKVHWTVEPLSTPECEIYIDIEGTTGVTATLEKRGNDSVWVVRPDPLGGGGETATGGYCLGSASTFNPPGGGYGVLFFQAAGDLVIPHDGGTVPAKGSRPIAGVAVFSVDGTVTGTVEKKK